MANKEFTVPLRKAKMKGKSDIQTANRAIAVLFQFFKKHFRKEKNLVILAKEVNEEIWKNSNRVQSKIKVQTVEKDGKVFVYLKDSRELKELSEKAKAAEKKESKKEEKPAEKKAEAIEAKHEKTHEAKSAEKKDAKKPVAEKKEPKGKTQ